MQLADWILLALFFALIFFVNLKFKKQASSDLASFFLGGRNIPWYIAGISMVATTFAADTPLWVAEKISQHGISGNWLWWNMLIGGMLTTFFFARLWRRANILTELEFLELRYSGKAAAFLRGFRAVYLGVFMNAIIIGWVNFALATILRVFFNLDDTSVMWCVFGAMLFVGFYSSISGLIGVAMTDAIQFVLAMAGCIILAIYVVNQPEVGGLAGLKAQLPEWRFRFFPKISDVSDLTQAGIYSITPLAFISFAAVQWWASWYPGAEPGGGGYVAQRMMSTRNEKGALWATLLFQIAHYCLRPWPWIITGLALLVLYPDNAPEMAADNFVHAMNDYLPAGVKGLLLAAFLGAYMSTISTQLNWGAGFITHDLVLRFFVKRDKQNAKSQVRIGRISNLFLMLCGIFVTTQISTLDQAARFLINCGAGLGLVLILRWYWWRINAWSEISATLLPVFFYILFHLVIPVKEPLNFLLTVACSTLGWILVTLLTRPEKPDVLQAFYNRVKPGGWWKQGRSEKKGEIGWLLLCWFTSVIFTYSILIGIGKWLFLEWTEAVVYLVISIVTGILLVRWIPKALKTNGA